MHNDLATDDAPSLAPTATALLDVAERLFADRGLGNVSLRQIVAAAGQGNLSAAHYHFGSRESLIRAVIERRMRTIDAIRHRRLDAVEAAGRAHELPAIIGAAVETLAEVVRRTPWGADYVRVLAQALFDPGMRLLETTDPSLRSGIDRARTMARRLLPGLPQASFEARVTIVHHETAYAFARWVTAHGRVDDANRRDYRAMVRGLIEFMSAGLAAPVLPSPSSRARGVGHG
ncbi:MAG: TetR/AcrR family transcriptional regulator [Burkholderiales bacterium]|nr:MAG: TetR/AcrR family transcriptional regulator [Burkholderiales bacterium]